MRVLKNDAEKRLTARLAERAGGSPAPLFGPGHQPLEPLVAHRAAREDAQSPAGTVRFRLAMHRVVPHKGCDLSYTVRGEGPPVLFIQGVGVHGSGWAPQIDGLAGRYQCVSFDNRGLGLSQPRGCAITVEQMAEDTTIILDALGVSSAHVVGHSLGGLVALHLALTSRARVRSLALLCSFARGRAATRLSTVLLTGLRTKIGPRRQRRRAFLQLVMPRHVLEAARPDELAERLAPIFGHDLGEQPPITMTQVSAMRAYDARPRLAELDGLPTLVVSAAHDRIALPAVGRAMASAIPGARYVELPDAAHGATIQCAVVLNALLAGHFAGESISARREAGCVAADHADHADLK